MNYLKKAGMSALNECSEEWHYLLGIHSIVIKKYRHFSDNKPVTEKENILNQDFTATGINQKWCTDITYIHTQKNGWTYLASVMDFL